MDEVEFQRLLDLVYGAAVEPKLWPRVLTRLSDLTGSHGAVMVRQNEQTGDGAGIRAEPNAEATQLYYGYFATRNVFLQADNARAAVNSYRPSVLTDEHKVPKANLLRSEYYNDFMRRFDFHSVLMFRLAVAGMDTVIVNLHRTRRAGEYGGSELGLADALLPHLIHAFDGGQKIAASRALIHGLADAQDCAADGVFLVNEDGRIRHANAAGEALLADRGPLRSVAGRLSATAADQARRLEGLIRQAASTDPALRSGGEMAVLSPGRHRRLSVTVVPVGGVASSLFTEGRSVIVCVTDPDAHRDISESRLRAVFDLTPAEARVACALFKGLEPAEAAERLGVAMPTIRSHLAHIYAKTGAAGQGDLLRLLGRLTRH